MHLKRVNDIQKKEFEYFLLKHSFGCVFAEKGFKDFLNLVFAHKKHFQHSYIVSTVKQNSSALGVAIV